MPLKPSGWEKMAEEIGAELLILRNFPACGMTLTIGIALCSTAWVQKIKAASEQYIETEKKKREKAYQGTCGLLYFPLIHPDAWAGPFLEDATVSVYNLPLQTYCRFSGLQPIHLFLTSLSPARSQKTSGIGRLMVHVIEATELKACKPNGK